MTDAVAPGAGQEFRPSWAAFHRRLLARMAFMLPLGILILAIALWPSIGLAFIMLGAALSVGGLLAAIYFSRARVRISADTVQLRGLLRRRRWASDEVAQLVFLPLLGPANGPQQPATLYAVSPLNTRLFWLSGEVWERTALDEIGVAIGAPVHEVPAGLTPKEVQQRFPGTIGWTSVHPWLFVLLLTGIATFSMLLVALLTGVLMLLTGQTSLPTGL